MSQNVKRYLISSGVTFASAFVVVLLANWELTTLEAIKTGAIGGVLFTALRAGVKALLETSLSKI